MEQGNAQERQRALEYESLLWDAEVQVLDVKSELLWVT